MADRDFKVFDTEEREITEGTRVIVYGTTNHGIVKHITDVDGDVDDYGRSVMVNPTVVVEFDKDEIESFNTTCDYKRSGYLFDEGELVFECEDLDVQP
jgi:hypothetical protein